MPATDILALPISLDAWHVDAIRLTIFYGITPQGPFLKLKEIWDQLKLPEPTTQIQVAEQQLTQIQGEIVNNIIVVLIGQPGQIHLHMHKPRFALTWASGTELIKSFGSLLFNSVSSQGGLATRVAMGCKAGLPSKSREHSYRQLAALLPGIEVDESSCDFFYRVNRRYPDAGAPIAGVYLNRLSTWAAIVVNTLPTDASEVVHFATVELDCSTPGDSIGGWNAAVCSEIALRLLKVSEPILTNGHKG